MPNDQGSPTDTADPKGEAELAKLVADARAADAAARKAEAEAAVAEADAADATTELGRQRRDAETRKTIAVADKDAAAARQAEVAAALPDLSKVTPSKLSIAKEGPPIAGTGLTYGALGKAAETIAEAIQTALDLKRNPDAAPPEPASAVTAGPKVSILVTTDADLATPDSVYHDVVTGLEQLSAAASKVLEATDPQRPRQPTARSAQRLGFRLAASTAVVGAIAGALPHVLSLLSSERSVRTAAATVTDLAASAAVAGALRANDPSLDVFHDDFRLLHAGKTYGALITVNRHRQDLVARKLLLSDQKSVADAALTRATEDVKRLSKGAEAPRSKQAEPLAEAQERVERFKRESDAAAVRISIIDSLIPVIDAFTAAIRVAPASGGRSPLATAALHELLHADGATAPQVSHVLLVRGQAGTAVETTDNRPLWLVDKFSSVVDVSVTYMLIGSSNSGIVDAGTVTATATAHGDIGEAPKITFSLPSDPPARPASLFRIPRRDPAGVQRTR